MLADGMPGMTPEQVERALRTRPDYNLRCDDCGAPHNLDTSIPSEIWNKIASDASVLCTLCIDDRVAAAKLACRCEFYFVGRAIRSRLYDDSFGNVAKANREAARFQTERDALQRRAKKLEKALRSLLDYTKLLQGEAV